MSRCLPNGLELVGTGIFTPELIRVSKDDWVHNDGKRSVDEIMDRTISQIYTVRNKIYTILCFPSDMWAFEEYLVRTNPERPYLIIGIERVRKINETARKNAQILSDKYPNAQFEMLPHTVSLMDVINGKFESKWFIRGSQFDVVYADYMAIWNTPMLNDIVALLKGNLLSPYSVFGFTVTASRNNKPLLAQTIELAKSIPEDYRVQPIDKLCLSRIKRKTYSRDVIPQIQGIHNMVLRKGREIGVSLIGHAPYLYSSPTGKPECLISCSKYPTKVNETRQEITTTKRERRAQEAFA